MIMPVLKDVLDAARKLTAIDRMRLVEALWEDVSPSDWPAPTDEWIAEAQKRSAEYDQGIMSAATWSEVRNRARQRAGLNG
jgi:putative addiction module component (TIGR02574 family)